MARRPQSPDREASPADAELLVVVHEMSGRLQELEPSSRKIQASLTKFAKRLNHIESGIASTLRKLYFDNESLPFPQALTAERFHLGSQNDEYGLTFSLLRRIGMESRRFIELGCGVRGGNSAFLVQEMGWDGIMIDADESRVRRVARRFGPRVTALADWVTCENINDLLETHGFSGEVDVLSIDIDGNDYWIWDAIDVCTARLVIIEYNSAFGADAAVAVPYQADFDRRALKSVDPQWASLYYGAPLGALARLGEQKGYRLVATEPRGINAYFLRNDVGDSIPGWSVADAFHIPERYNILLARRDHDLLDFIRRVSLPIEEIA